MASLLGLETEIRRLGGDLEGLLAECGMTVEQLGNEDAYIGLEAVIRVLSLAAERLPCPDFGMRVAGHQGVGMLGLLGRLIASEPDFESAFRTSQEYLALHNKSENWHIQHECGHAYLQRVDHFSKALPSQQYREMALLACVRLILELAGQAARPLRVELSHSPIASPQVYKHHFGCSVVFDQEQDCLVYEGWVLESKLRPASKHVISAEDKLACGDLLVVQHNLERQVRALIAQSLGQHQHSLEHIATRLAMHPRMLQRRLQAEKLCFKELVQDVKMQVACRHLQSSAIGLTRLASALGYNTPAAFSKAFKSRCGVSPSHWRKLHGHHP